MKIDNHRRISKEQNDMERYTTVCTSASEWKGSILQRVKHEFKPLSFLLTCLDVGTSDFTLGSEVDTDELSL